MHIFVLVAKLYVRPRPPGGTREIRRLIQVSSPKTCSETISGDERRRPAGKWGGLFWATSFEKK